MPLPNTPFYPTPTGNSPLVTGVLAPKSPVTANSGATSPTPTSLPPAGKTFVQNQVNSQNTPTSTPTPVPPTPPTVQNSPQNTPIYDGSGNVTDYGKSIGVQPNQNTSTTSQDAFNKYYQSLLPSADETAANQRVADIQTQEDAETVAGSHNAYNALYTPGGTVSGANTNSGLISRANSQSLADLAVQESAADRSLGVLQTNRSLSNDALKAGLDYATSQQTLSKPVFAPVGEAGYQLNPATGQYESIGSADGGPGTGINPATGLQPNATDGQITALLTQTGIPLNGRNTGIYINAIKNGATVQDILSGKFNSANATAGAGYYTNPLTGARGQNNASYTPPGTNGIGRVGSLNSSNTNSSSSSGNLYTVKPGDTFYSLAQQNGTTVQALQAANPGVDVNNLQPGQSIKLATSGGQNQSSGPDTLPAPTSYAQKAFAQDFTSGGLADTINAQNTAVGHLTAALDLATQMQNWSLQPGNAGKNFLSTVEGKAAVDNYTLAHTLSSSELSSAYGNDTGAERSLTAALGSSNSSPEQIKGFAQTSAQLLSSKILSNIQQYKTAYGQNAPVNLNWFISPENQQALGQIGIQIHQSGNEVGAYKLQPDGSYKKI